MSLANIKSRFTKWGFSRAVYDLFSTLLNKFFIFQNYLCLELDTHKHQLLATTVSEFKCRELSADDLLPYVQNSTYEVSNEFVEVFRQRKDRCFGAFHNEKLVGYVFFTAKANRMDPWFLYEFPSQDRYLYKAFTLPEYRGRGSNVSVIEYGLRVLIGEGVRYISAWILTHNYPSRRSFHKLGFVEIPRFVGLGKWNKFMTFQSKALRLRGKNVIKSIA